MPSQVLRQTSLAIFCMFAGALTCPAVNIESPFSEAMELGRGFSVEILTSVAISDRNRLPTPVIQPLPEYPLSMRLAGITGLAVLRVLIDAKGSAASIAEIRTTHPDFGRAASNAVARWTYNPATARRDTGTTVACSVEYTFRFNLTDDISQPAGASMLMEVLTVTTPSGRQEKVTREYSVAEFDTGVRARASGQLNPFDIQHPVYPDKVDAEKLKRRMERGDTLWYFRGVTDSGWAVARGRTIVWVLVTNHEY